MKRMKTYIVDDDKIMLFIVKKLMKISGFDDDPKLFEKPEEAVEALRAEYNPNDHFVIFLDINMPAMNGWEFLDEIDSFISPDNTVVFMISSSVDQSDILRAESHKLISRYLEKPLLVDHLVELKQWLETRWPSD